MLIVGNHQLLAILIFGQLKDIVYFLIQKCVNTQLRCCKNILYGDKE